MRSAIVAPWNVLHSVHARKHSEDLSAFPTEEERARAVVDRVDNIHAEVKCLQEVSGDTLKLLVTRVGDESVHSFRLPRIPKHEGDNVLRDASENLVDITAGAGMRVHAQSFDGDDGKGFIAVRCPDDTVVACAHISFGSEKRMAQLRVLDHWITEVDPGFRAP